MVATGSIRRKEQLAGLRPDLAFVNPMDAWTLHNEHGFLPMFRTELYDEVVFFTAAEASATTLDAIAGQALGAVDRQFATYLGLYLLRERGITPQTVRFYDSWIQVIRAVTKGEVPYGVLYRDFFTELSPLSRSTIQVIHESQTRYATHMFLLNSKQQGIQQRLHAILEGMPADPQGKALLDALNLGRWVPTQDLGLIAEIVTGGAEVISG